MPVKVMKKEHGMKWFVALAAMIVGLAGAAGSAEAAFQLSEFSGGMTQNGVFSRQAGAHIDLTTKVAFPTTDNDTAMPANPRIIDVDLPAGIVGNPLAVPTCAPQDLIGGQGDRANCPVESQIGVVEYRALGGTDTDFLPVYNVERPADAPALFAFNFLGSVVPITPHVRPTDFGITAHVGPIPAAVSLVSTALTLWGVPADPSHDAQRYTRGPLGQPPAASAAPRRAFMTNGTECSTVSGTFAARSSSWQEPDVFGTQSFTADTDGVPFINDRCDRLPFAPTISVQPTVRTADAPTGLDVTLNVPQSDAPDGLATAHVRTVTVRLPNGLTVSPSSAAGLGACSPAQIGLGTDAVPACPDSSKVGSVTIDTPLLDVPLTGDVILASQNDNPFHSLLALYIVARGPGVLLKLPGRIDLDQATGQLVTTFDNTPQLPFSTMHLTFLSGPQAPLATPTSCGTYTSHADITSWASSKPVSIDTPMTIDQGCGTRNLAPTVTAGSTDPSAGASSPFALTVTRGDRTQFLARIAASLPPGLLARVADVPQCAAAQAAQGTCPATSQIGTVTTAAGPGAEPLVLNGRVYFTGPYNGAPFGLSIVVPTAGQAGPFDLGDVVVRAALAVDRTDAHVTVTSDPLPTIIQGIPLRLRQVKVTIDRPKFTFNPTTCSPLSVGTTIGSTDGVVQPVVVPFRAVGCADLDLLPKLAIRFKGAKSTKDGQHPGVIAKLTEKAGGTNLKKVVVKLPLSVALDPDNAQALCKPEERAKLACPKASIVGTATARSILPHALQGPVYFVEGTRRSKTGRVIKTLPKLWIPLSADGVTIDVNASSDVDDLSRLVTTFDSLPDAPISSFQLNINGGKHGILVVSGNPGTCARDKTLDSQMTGQNGKVLEEPIQVSVDGCKKLTVASSSASSRSALLRVVTTSSGKLRLRGASIVGRTVAVKAGRITSVAVRLTSRTRAAVRRHGKAKVKVSATFVPSKGKVYKVARSMTAKR